jgi:endoglucanase
MDYRIWIEDNDWRKLHEAALVDIDQAIAWGEKYRIHVCLNFHRAPGHFVGDPLASPSLWTDLETLEVCALHWAWFARRYQGHPSTQLSFNLLNEPHHGLEPATHLRIIQRLVEAVHAADPVRLIIADGRAHATQPCPELLTLPIAQSTRGYAPMWISHYQADWTIEKWEGKPAPTWPLIDHGEKQDRARLWKTQVRPWKELEAAGTGVMVGEWGAFHHTPYEVTLRWMEDCLINFQAANWGWALWNLQGSFGVLESRRPGAIYEDFQGRQLDRRMLELLQRY